VDRVIAEIPFPPKGSRVREGLTGPLRPSRRMMRSSSANRVRCRGGTIPAEIPPGMAQIAARRDDLDAMTTHPIL
jgi:hypothetical protein